MKANVVLYTQRADRAVDELRGVLAGHPFEEVSVHENPGARRHLEHLQRSAPCVVVYRDGAVWVATGHPGQATEALNALDGAA